MTDDLEERNRQIVEMRGSGATLRAVGAAFGIGPERVSQIWLRHERHRKRREAMEARQDYCEAFAAIHKNRPVPGHVRLDVIAYLSGAPDCNRVVSHLAYPPRCRNEEALPAIETVADFRRVSPVAIARRYPSIGRKCLLPFMALLGVPVPDRWRA